MSVQISTSVDETTIQQFNSICDTIGISPANALSLFVKDVINHKGIPFNLVIPMKNIKKSMGELLGCMRGQFTMTDDFDAPLDDFREYME